METVPNQKTIRVQKEPCDKAHLYAVINQDALQFAMLDLKGESLKLWLYMAKNQDGYTFALSRVDALKWGIGSTSSYNRAVTELKEKGYLIETSSNHYDFYEIPRVEEMTITVNKNAVYPF